MPTPDDTRLRKSEATFARSLGCEPGDVFAAIGRHHAKRVRRARRIYWSMLALIAALLFAGVALADEPDADALALEAVQSELADAERELVRARGFVRGAETQVLKAEREVAELRAAVEALAEALAEATEGEPPVVDPPPVDPPDPAPAPTVTIRVAPGADIDAAVAQLEEGGELLFERGGVYDLPADRDGELRWWRIDGLGAERPTVIGAYGDPALPRPVLRSNGRGVFRSIRASHLVLRDLHLQANDRLDGRNADTTELGIVVNAGDDIRIERVLVEAFKNNIELDAWPRPTIGEHVITNVTLDGCEVVRSHCSSGHSQGLYAKQVRGLTVTGCVFDHNGWSDEDSRTGFNHNVYLSMCDEVRILGNVLANGSNMGVKLRSDEAGAMRDVLIARNLFTGNLTGITASGDDNHDTESLVIRDLTIRGNVFTDHGGELPGGAELGHAVKLRQVGGALVAGNLLIDLGNEINRQAFNVGGLLDGVLIENNVLENWPMARGREPLTSDSDHAAVTLRGNRVERGVATRRPADYDGDPLGMAAWLLGGVEE